MQIAMKHFEMHFREIGWFPTREYGGDVTLGQKEDGTWIAAAWLGKGSGRVSREWDEFPHMGVNDTTEAEALAGKRKTIHSLGGS